VKIRVPIENKGHAVTQLIEALRYKPEGHRFNSRWCVKIRVPIENKGHAVTQLIEALRYKPEGHRFNSRWCHWIFY
jgi:2-keto-3-deoxy-L-rhamnonate aldolase RhmA